MHRARPAIRLVRFSTCMCCRSTDKGTVTLGRDTHSRDALHTNVIVASYLCLGMNLEEATVHVRMSCLLLCSSCA